MTPPTEGDDPEEWADAIQATTLGVDESPPTEGGDHPDAIAWCDECDGKGLPAVAMFSEGVRCLLCGQPSYTPFREGWDESD